MSGSVRHSIFVVLDELKNIARELLALDLFNFSCKLLLFQLIPLEWVKNLSLILQLLKIVKGGAADLGI